MFIEANNDAVFQYERHMLCYLWILETSLMKYMNYIADYSNNKILSNDTSVKFYNLLNVFINYFRNVMHQKINDEYY